MSAGSVSETLYLRLSGSPLVVQLQHAVKPRYQYLVWVALATTTAIAAAAVCYLLWMSPPPRSRDTTRFVLQLPVGQDLVVPYAPYAPALDLSRDGRNLAYVAHGSEQHRSMCVPSTI
jgi:hypothetical protein